MFNLQTQILDLTDELELRKIREDELLRQQAMDSKHVIEEIEELRVSYLILIIKLPAKLKSVSVQQSLIGLFLTNFFAKKI